MQTCECYLPLGLRESPRLKQKLLVLLALDCGRNQVVLFHKATRIMRLFDYRRLIILKVDLI
jgi:hypothetical protein